MRRWIGAGLPFRSRDWPWRSLRHCSFGGSIAERSISKISGIIPTPSHTPGHHALLVHLASGTVLLSGDQYHFTENRRVGGVPGFNRDRADTLASHDRFEKLATNAKAKVVIQHEPADVAKLPTFPKAAE